MLSTAIEAIKRTTRNSVHKKICIIECHSPHKVVLVYHDPKTILGYAIVKFIDAKLVDFFFFQCTYQINQNFVSNQTR